MERLNRVPRLSLSCRASMISDIRRRFNHLLWLIPILILMGACQPFVDQDQPRQSDVNPYVLTPGKRIGQTFVAHHGGLSGVAFWLVPQEEVSGRLVFHLRSDPQSEEDIRTASVPVSAIDGPAFHRFVFEPIRDSHSDYYYAFVDFVDGRGSFEVGSAPGDTYLNGASYIEHEPQDAQLSFQLTYTWPLVLLDLGMAAIKGATLLGAAALLYVVPGWALLAWLWRGRRLSWAEGLGLSIGVSVCVYPVMMSWLHLIGLNIGVFNALLPVGVGSIALLWRYRPWRLDLSDALRVRDVRIPDLVPDVALIIVILLGFAVRGIVIRSQIGRAHV